VGSAAGVDHTVNTAYITAERLAGRAGFVRMGLTAEEWWSALVFRAAHKAFQALESELEG